MGVGPSRQASGAKSHHEDEIKRKYYHICVQIPRRVVVVVCVTDSQVVQMRGFTCHEPDKTKCPDAALISHLVFSNGKVHDEKRSNDSLLRMRLVKEELRVEVLSLRLGQPVLHNLYEGPLLACCIQIVGTSGAGFSFSTQQEEYLDESSSAKSCSFVSRIGLAMLLSYLERYRITK